MHPLFLLAQLVLPCTTPTTPCEQWVSYDATPARSMLGQVEVLPLGSFDGTPYTETLGASHRAIIVPECGHNDRCIFTTDIVLPVIFP